MEENNYTVYMHKTPSKKVYIGITSMSPEKRWRNGKHYEDNEHFTRAVKKYEWENIEHIIIKNNLQYLEAIQLEKELISKYKSNDSRFGYNKSSGGDGCIGFKISDETRLKISNALKGKNHPAYGKHPSKETRLKMSIAKKGNQINKGRTQSYETKAKISNALKGKKLSDETRVKLSIAAKGRKTRKTTVRCIETGVIYEYTKDAEVETGINRSHISDVCKGKRKTAGGYHWQYLDIGLKTTS